MKEPGSEVLERELLNRILWDPNLNPSEYSVKYLDRVSGELVEVPYTEIQLDGEFIRRGDSLIPMHRVREILHNSKIVWDKRRVSE